MALNNFSEHILEQLFDSTVKVRLLKLFLRNEESAFTLSEVRRRTQLESGILQRQLEKLHSAGFLKVRTQKTRKTEDKSSKEKKKSKKVQKKTKKIAGAKEKVFSLNPEFVFYNELRNLVLQSSPASKERMARRIKNLGKIKLAVLSGIFTDAERANLRTDLLIVGDNISERKL